jgi:nucleoside-diphosphate-sugar epimerase
VSTILVTGANGQIGTELTRALRRRHGADRVVASGRVAPATGGDTAAAGPFDMLDVTDRPAIDRVLERHRVDTIYHLAALLSAVGETDPQRAWTVNMGGLYNVLEAARTHDVRQIFWPSSIAAFGPDTPRDQTPQDTLMRPTTVYGVAKVAGELLCDYYVRRYGLDVRGVRYPGVISSETLPGGGTTDYAVAIFYAALRSGRYTCFVREDTVLPMIYMPDCITAALDLMDADASALRHRNAFNLAAMSFSAGELAAEIGTHVPGFVCTYEPDARQSIADSWPRTIDDTAARQEWGWAPQYGLAEMTADMVATLRAREDTGSLGL